MAGQWHAGVAVALVAVVVSAAADGPATARAAPSLLPPIEIAPGVLMPMVSCGHPDDGCEHGRGPGCEQAARNMTEMWISLGGRGVDTAEDYQNQPDVGAAIASSIAAGIVTREEIFVTTKINLEEGPCTQEAAFAAVKEDVKELNLSYIDLVLHHFPCNNDEENKAAWLGLVQARAMGLTRTIGVSHYSATNLEAIMSLGKGAPAVNQCEMCIGNHDDSTINFCKAHNITYEAYGALRSVDFSNQKLISIAATHNVSTAQVALRWVAQHDCPLAVSPGLNREYAVEDMSLGSFKLTDDEMAILSAI